MSIKLMHEVWTLKLTPTEATVLAHFADHANDAGLSYPSIGLIAWKSNLGERSVQVAVRSLRDAGLIEPVGSSAGGRGLTVRYRLRLDRGTPKPPYREKGEASAPFVEKGEPNAPIREPKGARAAPIAEERVHQVHHLPDQKGAVDCLKGARAAPEPSLTVKRTGSKESGESARGHGDRNGNADAAEPARAPVRFPLDQTHYAFGAELGIPRDRLETETAKFVAHHEMHGNRRRNWEAAWRKWMLDVPGFDRGNPTNPARTAATPGPVGRGDGATYRDGGHLKVRGRS